MHHQASEKASRVQDAFFQRELEITEIGVVTPYVAQVRLLKRRGPLRHVRNSEKQWGGADRKLDRRTPTTMNRIGLITI